MKPTDSPATANFFALAAIALWALLAWLGISLRHVPPFLLTGVALLVGSVIALPLMFKQGKFDISSWKMPWQHLALGIYGLFGFHFLLFIALRHAPPVQANLVNYLWPLGIVVMAPLFLPGVKLSAMHLLAACMGFAGACIAILGARGGDAASTGFAWGYIPAAGSAFIWASYSLMTKRLALQGKSFATAAIGLFGLASGLLEWARCHAAHRTRHRPARRCFLPVGRSTQAWRRAANRHLELHHASGLHSPAADRHRPAAELEHWLGSSVDCGRGGARDAS
jgi:drug/metabolite transporter (DMT)-like permease